MTNAKSIERDRVAADSDVELLPCPFDGATPEIGSIESLGRMFYWVACSCSAQGPESQRKLRAISKWNTRTRTDTHDHNETGLNLFRQLVRGKNALRQLNVFWCNDGEHVDDCKCFWEQCEKWAAEDAAKGEK